MEIATLVWLALSTLVSEDLASISAGLLARDRHLPVGHAVAACVVGIYVGDLGLWMLGRLLQLQALRFPRLRRTLEAKGLTAVGSRIDARLGVAIVASRFVPGSRLPMYVALGFCGRRPLAFAAWSLLAVIVWTPLVVVATALLGEALAADLLANLRLGAVGTLLTAIAILGAARLVSRAVARIVQRYHQRFDQTIETPI